jgi:hypothetical protein
MMLSPKERARLGTISVCIAFAIAIVHLYVKWTNNVNFISNYYYLPNEIKGQGDIAQNLSTITGLYFIPRGSALIMITTVFLMARVVLKYYKNFFTLGLIAISLGVCLVCSITFAQRSFIMVMPLITLLYMLIAFKTRRAVSSIFMIIFLLCASYAALYIVTSKTNLADVMIWRITQSFKTGSLDPRSARLAANLDAFNHVLVSPAWGTGSIVTEGSNRATSNSQNAHALLRVGLIGGIPAIVLMIIWLAKLLFNFFKLIVGPLEPGNKIRLCAFGAVLCGIMMMLLNTLPILIYSFNVIPFVIFIGLFIGEYGKWEEIADSPGKRQA